MAMQGGGGRGRRLELLEVGAASLVADGRNQLEGWMEAVEAWPHLDGLGPRNGQGAAGWGPGPGLGPPRPWMPIGPQWSSEGLPRAQGTEHKPGRGCTYRSEQGLGLWSSQSIPHWPFPSLPPLSSPFAHPTESGGESNDLGTVSPLLPASPMISPSLLGKFGGRAPFTDGAN